MKLKLLLSLILAMASVSIHAFAIQPAEPWHGRVLQVDVSRRGADWVPREVMELRHAHTQNGDTLSGFVQVEIVEMDTRKVSLTCKGEVIASMIVSASGNAKLQANCFGISYRLVVLDAAAANYPKVGTLPVR